jgi:hypothetical protein
VVTRGKRNRKQTARLDDLPRCSAPRQGEPR